jgi:hypothetical protein
MANTWVRTVISSWRSRRQPNIKGELVSAMKDVIVIQKLIFWHDMRLLYLLAAICG